VQPTVSNRNEYLLQKDYLKILLEYYYPFHFFAIFRAHELYNVEPYIKFLQSPILDIGCGDGFIAYLLFGKQIEFGIDSSIDAVDRAMRKNAYKQTFLGDAHNIPLESNSLGGIFSNCALEHIPQTDMLLSEIVRVLKPGAYFIATALSPFYYDLNPVFRWFDRKGLRWLRKRIIDAENILHNHVSIYIKENYADMFNSIGMSLEIHKYYCTEDIAYFCTQWDTLSKYIIPCPSLLTHGGVLTKYLILRYGRRPRGRQLDLWHKKFFTLCYQRNESNNRGVGQILIARKK